MCALFPSRTPQIPGGVEPVAADFPKIAGAELAASIYGQRVAGDFYDAIRVNSERVLFGLLDVAGLREDIRPILSGAQNLFRSAGVELFSAVDVNESEAMTALCLRLNRGVMEAAGGVHSCPAFLGCYHERLGTLCYSNAGHTPGLLRRDGMSVAELESTGLPLGLFSHATSDAPIVGLEEGAALLLVSRAVVESKSKEETDGEFGLDRVKQQMSLHRQADAQTLSTAVLNAVVDFAGVSSTPEDLTALALVRNR